MHKIMHMRAGLKLKKNKKFKKFSAPREFVGQFGDENL